jgi:hypothetical protein
MPCIKNENTMQMKPAFLQGIGKEKQNAFFASQL